MRQVDALCQEAADETARVLKQPKPVCLVKGFGDSAVNLELRIWINDPRNTERIHGDKKFVEEDLRKAAFQGRKLAQAATKPMCVGVFGPSVVNDAINAAVINPTRRPASRDMQK